MNAFRLPAAAIETLGWVLFHSVWQLALVALVACGLNWAMRRCSAKARYAMLVVALAAMTAAPVATLLVLPLSPPVSIAIVVATPPELETADDLSAAPESADPTLRVAVESRAGARGADGAAADTIGAGATRAVASQVDMSHRLPAVGRAAAFWAAVAGWWSSVELAVRGWLPTIVGLWCLGVCVFAWRPALSWYEVGRLRRVGVSPVPEHVARALVDLARRIRLSRAVQILESTRVRVPVVVGYLRPVILLPVSLVSQLPVPQLEAILAHELAHVRRHDYLVNLWQMLVETVLFYHPAVWWLSRRIRQERENCCDDVAVAVVADRVEYGRALLALEEMRGGATTLALGARNGSLLARIARLFAGERGHRALDSGNLVALALLTTSIVAVAVWASAIAKQPDEAAPTAEATEEPFDNDSDFVDAVSDRFAAALAKRNFSYITPENLTALRSELHDYLDERVTKSPAGARRQALLKAVERYVERIFANYLWFRDDFDVLKWEIWTAADRRKLSEGELRDRNAQRAWIRDFVRSVPTEEPNKDGYQFLGTEEQLQLLESEALNSPLLPFFYEPMSTEEFDQLKQALLKEKTEASWTKGHFAVGDVFQQAAGIRMEGLQKRWPPGCVVTEYPRPPLGGFSIRGHWDNGRSSTECSLFFRFNTLFARDASSWYVDERDGQRSYFDVAKNRPVDPPRGLDKTAAEEWLAEHKAGDIGWDAATRRLVAVRGARLTTVDEKDWYATDGIPLSELKKRLAAAPLAFYSLAGIPASNAPGGDKARKTAIEKLPTLVLESAEGNVMLLRITNCSADDAQFIIHHRPLPPNPPFRLGDGAAETQPSPAVATGENRVSENALRRNADAVSSRFAAALKKLELPYVTPEALATLRTELHDYLEARVKTPLVGAHRIEVLKALDDFVARSFSGPDAYRHFRERFDMLKWQLWTASDRRELTSAELEERESQRDWMRDFIRSLPEDTQGGPRIPEYSVEGRLIQLESVVFGNPLSPFFHEPMPAEEFEKFKQRVLEQKKNSGPGFLINAPSVLFMAAVFERVESLRRRWPPGFPVGGLSAGGAARDFSFRRPLFDYDGGSWLLDERGGERHYFDVTQNRTIPQPAPLDEAATQRWLSESKEGDMWFDGSTQRLIAVRGARVAALDEADWYLVDRIPLADLRKRLADKPLESYSLAAVAALPAWDPGHKAAFAKLPIFALQSADGKVVLFRIANHLGDSVALVVRPRPLPPYPPFCSGDVEYQRDAADKRPPGASEEEGLTDLGGEPRAGWSAADVALRKALDAESEVHHSRDAAVAEWKEVLNRSDLTRAQRGFAWWRIGSLWGYNFSRELGETSDVKQSEEAFIMARQFLSDEVTSESLNSATMYATIPGPPGERVTRLAEAFHWLMTRTAADLDRSAPLVNPNGSVLDKKLIDSLAHRPSTLQDRRRLLRQQLARYQETITDRISETIRDSQDTTATDALLKAIEPTADPKLMARWRSMAVASRAASDRGREQVGARLRDVEFEGAPASEDAPAGAAASAGASFVDEICQRFAVALDKRQLPFVTPAALAELKTDLHGYLAQRVKQPLAEPGRTGVLKAIDEYVATNFASPDCYLRFRPAFDTLKWELWTASDRVELTPDQVAERERQRQWMRDLIRGVPNASPARTERELAELDNERFVDPLLPFLHEPMSAEEFDAFKQRVDRFGRDAAAASTIFASAAQVRLESSLRRWPTGFPVNGNLISGGQVLFTYAAPGPMGNWHATPRSDGRWVGFDVATGKEIAQPPLSDEKATELWRSKPQGDIRFDPAQRSLSPMGGAKMATLDEKQWYALDRISTADLRRRVAETPIASLSLANLPEPGVGFDPGPLDLPTLVVETAQGEIALLRIADVIGPTVSFAIRPRPLAPYPPFCAGEPDDDPAAERPKAEPADEAPKATAPTPKTGASERVIRPSDGDEQGLVFFDIETGKTFAAPFDVRLVTPPKFPAFVEMTPQLKDWIKANGVDILFHLEETSWSYMTFGMQIDFLAQANDWKKAAMFQAMKLFEAKDAQRLVRDEFPTSGSGRDYRDELGTFDAFRTRDDSVGVLQWTGVPGRGVKIRYRLMAPSADLSPETSHEFEIHHGLKAQRLALDQGLAGLFSESDFAGADLAGAKILAGAKAFYFTRFSQANLANASLSGDAAFQGAQFDGATLTGAVLEGGGSGLQGANFDGANLTRAKISGGPSALQMASFEGANLTEAILHGEGGALQLANFDGANLTGATIDSPGLGAFQSVEISGANFAGADLSKLAPQSLASSVFSPKTPPSYNRKTRFPGGFSPASAGWKLMP